MTRLLGIVAATCIVLAGCGGVENEPSFATAVERTEAVGSWRFAIEGAQKSDKVLLEFACTGSADHAVHRVQLDCNYDDLGDVEMIAIGRDFFVRGPWPVNAGGKWVKQTGETEDDFVSYLSPERLLKVLREASSETVRVGEEEVRGASTVRYGLTLDCEAAREGAGLPCDELTPVEVWIDDEGFVRRIALDDGAGAVTFEFFDFGADVEIETPRAADVLDEEDLIDEGSSSEPGQSCTREASPISIRQAAQVLVRHGFDVERDELGCSPGVAASLSNGVDAQESSILTCFVLTSRDAPGLLTQAAVLGRQLVRVERRLENLGCTLFVERRTDEAVQRLDAAYAELKVAVHP